LRYFVSIISQVDSRRRPINIRVHFIGGKDAAIDMRYYAEPSHALLTFFFRLGPARRTAYYEISLALYFFHVPSVDWIELC